MIPVTKPFLPPKEEYREYLDGIWDRQWLTNMGPLANELENSLASYLKVEHLIFVTNATIALQMAIKAFNLRGEIITTPFSFVATSSTIVWEGCQPVFVDIDAHSLNIDVEKIEQAITENTMAILATHVYGNPCNVEKIQEIADRHNLKVIYDAAHAFAVEINGKSIFEYGDISICSLHATKLYHSVEGGFMVTKDKTLMSHLTYMRNFGFNGPEAFAALGINGKNSEFHAAMGLVNLKYIDEILNKRKVLSEKYLSHLLDTGLQIPVWHSSSQNNHSYFPVIFENEAALLSTVALMEQHNIFSRRYFYPSLAKTLPYVDHVQLPITDDICKRVLCLPLYYDLDPTEVEQICRLIHIALKDKLSIL